MYLFQNNFISLYNLIFSYKKDESEHVEVYWFNDDGGFQTNQLNCWGKGWRRQFVFRAPEPKAQAHYCDHVLSVVVTFSHFRILFWNPWTEFNESDRKQDLNDLQMFVFSDRSEKQDCRHGLWLAQTFSTSPLKPLNRFNQLLFQSACTSMCRHIYDWNIVNCDVKQPIHLTNFNQTCLEGRSQCLLPILCFFLPIRKRTWPPDFWLAEAFSTSPLKLLSGIYRNLTGSKISTSLTFVFFWLIEKTRW